jgi:predicted dehydrogenase
LEDIENGSIRLIDLDHETSVHCNNSMYDEHRRLSGNHSRWDRYRISFENALSAYLDSIRKGQDPPVPGMAGLEELQFEAALRRSIAEKRAVTAQKEFPV